MLVYVVLYMSHRVFWQSSFDVLCEGATEDCSVFSYSWEGFEANRGFMRRFLLPGGDKATVCKMKLHRHQVRN